MSSVNMFTRFSQLAISFCIICIAVSSCKQLDVYEKNVSIPDYQWKYDFKPGFDFEITDTASLYTIMVVLRHTDAYRYNNIWLDITALQDKDTLFKMPHIDLLLGNDSKGWQGTGMDDIWELRKPLSKTPVHFSKKGWYHFSVAQVMRDNPLQHVMSVGIRVEKTR